MKKYTLLTLSILLVGCGKSPTIETVEIEKPSPVVQIQKFFDFGCGHCREAHNAFKELKTEIGDGFELELKHFPLGEKTMKVAEASECARKQGKFDEFVELAYGEYWGKHEASDIKSMGETLGLNISDYKICIESEITKETVARDSIMGTQIGAQGTPFFLFNGQMTFSGFPGIDGMRTLIEKVRETEFESYREALNEAESE